MKTKNKTGKVTRFMDMHGGGNLKTPYTHIYIDAPLNKAVEIFTDTFKRNPNDVTCTCCGEDFVYDEYPSLEEATAYDRKCEWLNGKYDLKTAQSSLDDYFLQNKVLLIVE